jgi:hypothetical protein
MDRRGFLGAAAAVGSVAVAGEAASAATRGRPVAVWEELGGFVPAGYLPLRPPQLVIYGDGLVVADAAKATRLRRGQLNDFVDFAAEVLSNPANGVRRPGSPQVADVPSTKFTARRGRRTWSIEAEALGVLREYRAYPRPMYALLDRFTAHRDHVLRTGRPFTPDAVKLVTVRVEQPPALPVRPWPADVPIPAPAKDTVFRTLDLYGARARAVVRAMPPSFTTFRAPDGTFLSAGWRRLLPHE